MHFGNPRFSTGVMTRRNQMRNFGFRVKISYRLFKRYLRAQAVYTGLFDNHGEWFKRDLKELWSCDLNGYYCCPGFDSYGMMGCGCYGMTYREYWEDFSK